MAVPKWARKWLSEQDLSAVENAVKAAEKQTSAELVPMVVKRSSTVGHAPMLLALIGLMLVFVLEWIFIPQLLIADSLVLLPVDLVLVIVLVRLMSPQAWVLRLLTPKSDQLHQVHQRAQLEFYQSKIQQTNGKTGILLFVSLLERQVVVLADQAISQNYPDNTWSNIIDEIVASIKKHSLAAGLTKGIERCGTILAEHLPHQQNDIDELPDQLILKD